MSVKTGIPGPQVQPGSFGFNETGRFAVLSFEDVKAENITNMALDCERLGLSYQVKHEFGKSRIDIQYSYNPLAGFDVPIDLWEYSGRSIPKDLLQAATNTGITATLSAFNIEVIRLAMSDNFVNLKNASTDSQGVQSLNASCFTDGNPANALTIYTLMKSGMTDYNVRAPVIKHTQIVSAIYPVSLPQINVGKIISTPTLFAFEPTLPAWAVSGLPSIAAPAFSDGKKFVFAWYKNEPSIQQTAFKKITITQEYEYGLWPTDVLGTPL
jgi:hypothetical protein